MSAGGGYRYRTISFLSDYGLVDEFVGVCHGVILRLAPAVRCIDGSHGIHAQNDRAEARVQAQAAELVLTVGASFVFGAGGHRRLAPFGETVASVASGALVVVEDSHGLLAVSVNKGNAAELLGAGLGSKVVVGPEGSGAC